MNFSSRIIRLGKLPLIPRAFRKRATTGDLSKRINLATKCQIIPFAAPGGPEILGQRMFAFGGKGGHGFRVAKCRLMTQNGQGDSTSGEAAPYPCFATRLGGMSGSKDTQGWRDSSHTAMAGGGKVGSAKLPTVTVM